MQKKKKVLIYGYGNPGRQDDGLGIKIAEDIENWASENHYDYIKTDINYQLNIEDADLIKDFDLVLFADATIEEDVHDYKITEVIPSGKTEFTMHAVSPAFVLFLCHSLYNVYPKTILVHIRGYEWELKEGLSNSGIKNLKKAKQKILKIIE